MNGRRRRGIAVALVAAVAAGLSWGAAGCSGPPPSPEDRNAEAAWRLLQKEPTSANWKAFRVANLEAARAHVEMHDRQGVLYQIRNYEGQAAEALRTKDPAEATRLAFEVFDGINEMEQKDLLRVYDEVLPGSAERLRTARSIVTRLAR